MPSFIGRGRTQKFIVISITLVLLVGVIIAGGRTFLDKGDEKKGLPPPDKGAQEGAGSDEGYIFEGTTLSLMTPDGIVEWRLDAGKIHILEDSGEARLEGIRGSFLPDGEGRSEVTISAGNASADLNSRVIRFSDGVLVSSMMEGTLQVKDVIWYPDSSKLIGKGDVRFVKDAFAISGDSVEADVNLKKIKVDGRPAIIQIGM